MSSVSSFKNDTQNKWPADRGLEVYNEMTGLTLEKELSGGGVMIDIGPGRCCAALQELMERTGNVWAIGIAPNIPEEIPGNVTMFGGWAPTFPLLTDDRARVITDIFAGVSYGMKEVEGEWVPSGLDVLIRAAGWLAPQGVLVACTEVRRLGDGWAHERIERFFHEHMGLHCSFEVYEKLAEGNGVYENQLRVTIRNQTSYDNLVMRASDVVGRALRGRVIWESQDKGARIYEVTHVSPEYYDRNHVAICDSEERKRPSVSTKKPQWPDGRDLATYSEMAGFDLGEFLRDGDVYIDSGGGRECLVADELKRANSNIVSVAISKQVPQTIPSGVIAIPASLPEFNFARMKPARLITDIFGAVSFADKKSSDGVFEPAALEVLIRLATRLAPEGKLVVCTERDRFGDFFAWERITRFFKEDMGLSCRFEEYSHFAEDRQVEEKQLRIVIESTRDYEGLVKMSEEVVGVPKKGSVLWESREENPEERMQIVETRFEKPIKK